MEKTKAAAIVKRIVTSLILAPVVLWAVYCGSPVINLLALTGGALLAWEWAAMVPNGKASVYGIIYGFRCNGGFDKQCTGYCDGYSGSNTAGLA